jgi:hypothetical protein
MIHLFLLETVLTIVTTANLVLGLIVLFRAKPTPTHRWFVGFIAASAFLSFANLLVRLTQNPEVERLTYIAGIFLAATGLIWVHTLIERPFSTKKIIVIYSLASLIALSTLSNDFLSDIKTIDQIIFDASVGILYYAYLIIHVLNLLYVFYRLITYYTKTSGIRRSQLQYILTGIILYGITAITFGIALPAFGLRDYYFVVAPCSLFFIALTSYAMLKHRLFGFVFLVRRAAVGTGVIVSLSAIYLFLNLSFSLWLSTITNPNIAMIIAIILAVSFYPLLYPRFQHWVPKVLFPSQYSIEERDVHLKQLLIHSANLRKISTELQSYLMNHFHADRIEMYFFERTTQTYRSLDPQLPIFHQSDEPVHWIRENSTTLIDLEQHDTKPADYFQQRGLAFILPICHPEDGLLGWIGFQSDSIHQEDMLQLKKWIPSVGQSFHFILQYEDVMAGIKKDGMYPKHL